MRTYPAWIGVVMLGSAVGSAGCSHPAKTPVYDGSVVGAAVSVPVGGQRGRIVSVRDVIIKDGVDTSGSTSGSRGALVTAARVLSGNVTAIAGVIGEAMAGSKPSRPGEEITVAIDDGGTVGLVQERSNPPLAPDERVLVQKGAGSPGAPGGGTRIVREQQFAGSGTARDGTIVQRPARWQVSAR